MTSGSHGILFNMLNKGALAAEILETGAALARRLGACPVVRRMSDLLDDFQCAAGAL